MNISEEETEQGWRFRGTREENIIFSAFYILVFVFAVPGNVLALWAFYHQKKISPSKVFLCHLAIADVSYVLLLPMRIVYHINDSHWPLGHIICQLAGFLFYLNLYCSLYLMSLISLDRFLAVVLPIKSLSVRKAVYAKIVVALLWILSILSVGPMLFSKTERNNTMDICNNLYLEKKAKSQKALVSTVVAFGFPLITIVLCYIFILLRLRSIRQQEKRRVKDKAIKMIILIIVNFLFAFVPYHVSRIIYIQSHDLEHVNQETLGRLNWITSALTCVSGILDPVMYFFLNRAFRDNISRLFCKKQTDIQ